MVGKPYAHHTLPFTTALSKKTDPRTSRMIAFPHAGGSAMAFQRWGKLLSQDIELFAVQYPGREERADEALLCQPQTLLNELQQALVTPQDKPLILFGHSLGGRLALAVALMLPQPPLQLIISSCSSPYRARHEHLLRMSRNALLDALLASGGISDTLRNERVLLDFYLPIIRADLLLSSQLTFPQSTCYQAPLAVFQGNRDNWTDEQDLADWRQIASGEFQQHSFEGGHIYLEEQCDSVIARLHRLLAGHLAPTNV